MTGLSKRRPSPSMVVSVIALVVALSGTAVAAITAQSGDKLIKKFSLSGNRLRDHTLTARQIDKSRLGTVPHAAKANLAKSIPPVRWHQLTLQNGWTAFSGGSYGVPGYTKDAQGFVHLRGALASGASGGTVVIAQLPTGFRPSSTYAWLHASSTNGDGQPQLVDIYISGGNLLPQLGAGATGDFIDLDGITFYAG